LHPGCLAAHYGFVWFVLQAPGVRGAHWGAAPRVLPPPVLPPPPVLRQRRRAPLWRAGPACSWPAAPALARWTEHCRR
jgi:hypothetical protein